MKILEQNLSAINICFVVMSDENWLRIAGWKLFQISQPVQFFLEIFFSIHLPCNFFSVSQYFCNSVKYLSSMNTFDRPNVAMI